MEPSAPAHPPAAKEPSFGPRLSITGIILGILWILTFNSHPPQEGSAAALGTVVDQEISAKGICSPIAELVVDGVAYRSRPGVGAEPCEHQIGDQIGVSYHPDDIGGTFQIPYDEKDTGRVIVISLPGWVLLIASTVSLANNIRHRRKAKLNQS